MSLGLKLWLFVWSIISIIVIINNIHIEFDEQLILLQDASNVLLCAPFLCVLLGSILFQILSKVLSYSIITFLLSISIYFIACIAVLPYSFYSCIFIGILGAPLGVLHYILSTLFFGEDR